MRGAVLERTLGSGPQHLRLNGAADPSGEGAGEDKVQTGKLRMGQVAKLGPAGTETLLGYGRLRGCEDGSDSSEIIFLIFRIQGSGSLNYNLSVAPHYIYCSRQNNSSPHPKDVRILILGTCDILGSMAKKLRLQVEVMLLITLS